MDRIKIEIEATAENAQALRHQVVECMDRTGLLDALAEDGPVRVSVAGVPAESWLRDDTRPIVKLITALGADQEGGN